MEDSKSNPIKKYLFAKGINQTIVEATWKPILRKGLVTQNVKILEQHTLTS